MDYLFIYCFQTILNFVCMEKEKTPGKKIGLTKIDSSQLRYILPSPDTEGIILLEEVLSHRRSHRSFL